MNCSQIYVRALSFMILLSFFVACSSSSSQTYTAAQRAETAHRIDSNPLLNPALLLQRHSARVIHATLQKSELDQLQNTDILLRRGYGMVSDFIANYLEELYPVTHCGFVIRKEDSSLWILHAISSETNDGVMMEPIANYLKDSQKGSMIAVRLKGTAEKRQEVLDEAYQLLARKVPFDMGFNDFDSTQLYCAEMMRNIFKKVYRKDLISDRAEGMGINVLRMSNFFNPKYFEILFNHCDTTKKEEGKG